MDSLRELGRKLYNAVAAKQPTKRQLLKLDSKLICQIARDPIQCGLHVSYLVTAFEAVSKDWSTQDVIQQLVIPQTSEWRCRYVDTIDSSYVGKATYHLCHNLQAPFHQIVDSLRERFYTSDGQEKPETADAYIWIDAFAVNHHLIGHKAEYKQIKDVIAACRGTLVVIDGKCRALSRLLLLYEVWLTMQLSSQSKTQEPRLEVLTTCVDPRYLRNQMLHLDVRHASLLRDCDKDWLLDQLMSRGVVRVNRMIKKGIADSVKCQARRLLQELSEATEVDATLATATIHGLHVCAAITQLHGQYADAVHMYKHAVRLWEEHASVLGEENPLTLLMHYTEMLLLMKQWSDARQMAEEALQLSTSQRGMGAVTGSKARPSSMSGAHFSAEVYGVDRGIDAAAAKVPDPLELTLPPHIPCTVLLARALMGLGEAARAEALTREVCEAQQGETGLVPSSIKKRFKRDKRSRMRRLTSGANTARAMIALADVLRLNETGSQEAIQLYLAAQRGLAKAMGDGHPDVAYVQMRIGQLLRNQNKLEQAQGLLQQVLHVYEHSWGDQHPETASAMVYLADTELGMLQNKDFVFTDADLQSALQKATRQYLQAFEIRKACLGVNHPDTVATLSGAIVQLINSSFTRSQLAKAEPMCSLAVKCSMAMKQQADLGAHLSETTAVEVAKKQTINMVSNFTIMGMVLSTAGKAKDAMHVYEEGQIMSEAELSGNHQLTAHCLLGMADLHQVEHSWIYSEALYRKALAIYHTLLEAAAHLPFIAVPAPMSGVARGLATITRNIRRISLSNDSRPHPASDLLRLTASRGNPALARNTLTGDSPGATSAAGIALGTISPTVSASQVPAPPAGVRHTRTPSWGVGVPLPGLGGGVGGVKTGMSPRTSLDLASHSARPWVTPNFAQLSVVQEAPGSEIVSTFLRTESGSRPSVDLTHTATVTTGHDSPSHALLSTAVAEGSNHGGTNATTAAAQNGGGVGGGAKGVPEPAAAEGANTLSTNTGPGQGNKPLRPWASVVPGPGTGDKEQQGVLVPQRSLHSGSGPLPRLTDPSASDAGGVANLGLSPSLGASMGVGMGLGSPVRSPVKDVGILRTRSTGGGAAGYGESGLVRSPGQASDGGIAPASAGRDALSPTSRQFAEAFARPQVPSRFAKETAATTAATTGVVNGAGADNTTNNTMQVLSAMARTRSDAASLMGAPSTGGAAAIGQANDPLPVISAWPNRLNNNQVSQSARAKVLSTEPSAASSLPHADSMPTPRHLLQPMLSEAGTGASGSEARSSALGRFARMAQQKLAGTLVARASRDLASSTLAASSGMPVTLGTGQPAQVFSDNTIQVPKLGDALVSPHQLIMKLRGQLGDRGHALLQQEAAVAANNFALLLRWKLNFTEAETQFHSALIGTVNAATLAATRPVRQQSTSRGGAVANETTTVPGPVSPDTSAHGGNVSGRLAVTSTLHPAFSVPLSQGTSALASNSNRPEPQGSGPLTLPPLVPTSDPHLLHLRALILSNHAGLMAAQGRWKEAEDMYVHGCQLAMQARRFTDAMIIALNLLILYWGQGQEDKALSTARERVAPHLGTTLGPDAGRHGGRLHKEVMRQAVQDVQGSAVAINGSGAGNGMSAVFETHRPSLLGPAQYDLQRQIIEVLSERMVDDGGQVLYEWAAEAMALYHSARERHPDRTPFPRLPETVFLLQVPGIHLKCIHMTRWLLVLPKDTTSRTSAIRASDGVPFCSHIAKPTAPDPAARASNAGAVSVASMRPSQNGSLFVTPDLTQPSGGGALGRAGQRSIFAVSLSTVPQKSAVLGYQSGGAGGGSASTVYASSLYQAETAGGGGQQDPARTSA